MEKECKILIVEDEFLTINNLKKILIDEGYAVSGIARDVSEAMSVLNRKETDLVLLDINIQGDKDGTWLAEQIQNYYKIPFIFLTACNKKEIISRAVNYEPSGYIIKPFTQATIYSAIEVAISKEKHAFLEQQDRNEKDVFFIKEDGQYVRINISEILFAHSELKHVEIHLPGKRHVFRSNLSDFLNLLPRDMFFQSHRSYLINLKKINRINGNTVEINGNQIPLSSNQKTKLLKKLKII